VIDILKFRLAYGRQTVAWPDGPPRFPSRFRGRPVVDPSRCGDGCAACAEGCPTEAIADAGKPSMSIDLGRCLFCGECQSACPPGAVRFTDDHRLSARSREALLVSRDEPVLAAALEARMRDLFGRSLKLRQVSAGGCNGCEAELNASGNVQFDAGRFGIQFVASPRHADGIVVTGPVPENMRVALLKTYEAVPAPKLVVAVGACAISGGVFRGSPAVHDGAAPALRGVPVDLYVPGCPPHPITFLDGMLRMLGRLGPRDGGPRTVE
jgi:Ni,Fe-hydrogenase III small subunit/Pyruvate/2-oxoacid:ferredoxin oxidoreductase delta subunit